MISIYTKIVGKSFGLEHLLDFTWLLFLTMAVWYERKR